MRRHYIQKLWILLQDPITHLSNGFHQSHVYVSIDFHRQTLIVDWDIDEDPIIFDLEDIIEIQILKPGPRAHNADDLSIIFQDPIKMAETNAVEQELVVPERSSDNLERITHSPPK